MSKTKIQVELRNEENRLGIRYSKLIKLFFQLSIIFLIVLIIVSIGIYVFGAGHNWALLSIDGWFILINALIVVFIVLNILFYFHYFAIRNKRIELEKPKPEFINGKRVYIYTDLKGKDGGIFSKTYIEIDNHSILRLRTLIIPPNDLA